MTWCVRRSIGATVTGRSKSRRAPWWSRGRAPHRAPPRRGGHLPVRAGDREVPRREDRRGNRARGVLAMKRQRVAVLGLGKIGSILLDGLLKAGLPPESAVATVRHADRAQALGAKRRVPVGTDNRA